MSDEVRKETQPGKVTCGCHSGDLGGRAKRLGRDREVRDWRRSLYMYIIPVYKRESSMFG